MSGDNRPAIGDFPPGSRIAGYQIEELLGRGGMAVVYRAADVRLGRQVALKVLTRELTRDSAFRQRFIRESRAGAAVDHPNIIPVFEAGEADAVLFIAMRYVAGGDVRALIERVGPLPPARAANIVAQVASALDAAHARGLVHRDVKPANMLLGAVASGGAPDHVYLSDFGLSKLAVAAVSLTSTGQFLGTLDYMSPEQVEGRPIDGRTDLYALGCTAFEMLTGRPPFQRDQDLAVMWAQVSAPPPSACQLRPGLPADVDAVLAKALAKAPENRHSSCMEFATALKAACASRPARPPRSTPPPAEVATTGRQVPPATEAAMVAVPGSPPGPVLPPVESPPPNEATITEAAPGYRPGGYQPGRPQPSGYQPSGYQPSGYQPSGYQPSGYQPSAYQPSGYTPPQGYSPPGHTREDWPGGPGGSGYSQPGGPPPRRRGRLLPFLLGVLVVLVLAAAAVLAVYELNKSPGTGPGTSSGHSGNSRHGSSTPPSSPSSSAPASSAPASSAPPPTTPRGVLTAYYNAINAHQFRKAYGLSTQAQDTESFAQFKQGYQGTQHDTLTVTGVSGDVVSFNLTATQTDGSVKTYSGSYTVQDGKIVGSNVAQTG